jgi:NitT/TauT family transport system ATP-binding protein
MQDVVFNYPHTPVLRGVTMQVREGEVLSIVGASGCGKTTLLNMLAGFVLPQSGQVLMDGRPVTSGGPERAVVFQEDAVFPWRTVAGNVRYGLEYPGMSRKDRDRRVNEVLSLVGLQDYAAKYPKELSGGMRKRVDLARALAVAPRALLMDEPYAALDAFTKERLQLELLSIVSRQQMAVVFVTHDLEEAIFVASRVLVLRGGVISETLDVPFGWNRSLFLKGEPRFQELRARLRVWIEG